MALHKFLIDMTKSKPNFNSNRSGSRNPSSGKMTKSLHGICFSAFLFVLGLFCLPQQLRATEYNSNWFTVTVNPCTGLANVQVVLYNDESGTTNDDFWHGGTTLQWNLGEGGGWVTLATIYLNGGGPQPWIFNPHEDGYISLYPATTRTLDYVGTYWVASGDEQFYLNLNVELTAADIGKTIKFQMTGDWEDGGSSGEETITYSGPPDATSFSASDATDCAEVDLTWALPSGICPGAEADIFRDGSHLKYVTATDLTSTDATAVAGQLYLYKVRFATTVNGTRIFGGFSGSDNGTRKTT